jgi:hypothetical protein
MLLSGARREPGWSRLYRAFPLDAAPPEKSHASDLSDPAEPTRTAPV